MEEKTIKISTSNTLPDVVSAIKKGKWKIPRFQREFVWEKKKVIELLDSIYKEFPIGTFFLWQPPEEYAEHYKDISELKVQPDTIKSYTHFILDGQQRLTSLYCVFFGLTVNGYDYSNICFDLDIEKFNLGPEDDEKNISVNKILNQNRNEELYDDLTSERRKIFRKVNGRFSNYPFPVVVMEKKNIEEACKIFERINQAGKPLSIFDLVVAVTWDKDFDLRKEVDKFNKEIEGNFGKLNYEVFGETLSLIVKKQCTRVFQLKLSPNEAKENWGEVKKSIIKTIQFLRSNLKVTSYSYLPYRVFIPMIAYYFFNMKSTNVDENFLELWFWKASFANRYSGSSFTKMGEDRTYIFDKAINGEEAKINYDINVTSEKIKNLKMGRQTAFRNAILLLLLQNPLKFNNNKPVDIEKDVISTFNKSEKHHIFPKKYLKLNGIKETDLVLNFCHIDSVSNKSISASPPAEYFDEYKRENPDLKKALNSHLIPSGEDSGIWNNNYEEFIEQRAELIYSKIKEKIGDFSAAIDANFESTPRDIVEKLERDIRELILTTLYEDFGEDWWGNDAIVDPDVRQYAKEKIKKEKASKPYICQDEWNTSSKFLEQLTIPHYLKIIMKNWSLFEDIFGSKGDCQDHFNKFSRIRNQLSHIKTMDPVERDIGKASLKWIFKCIQTVKENEADEE